MSFRLPTCDRPVNEMVGLEQRLQHPRLRLLDCRHDLAQQGFGFGKGGKFVSPIASRRLCSMASARAAIGSALVAGSASYDAGTKPCSLSQVAKKSTNQLLYPKSR